MPDISGFEILKWMAGRGLRNGCVVLISASSQARIASVESSLVHSRLQKPFDLLEFQRSVRERAAVACDQQMAASAILLA